MIDALETLGRALARISAAAAAVVLALMVGLIAVDIALRNLLSVSTGFTDEFVAYGVSIITFLGLAQALEKGVLVRVGMVLDAVGNRARHGLELLSAVVAFSLFSFLAYFIWRVLVRDFTLGRTSNTVVATPLWIPEGLLFLGLAIFILRLLVYCIVTARNMVENRVARSPGASESEVTYG